MGPHIFVKIKTNFNLNLIQNLKQENKQNQIFEKRFTF